MESNSLLASVTVTVAVICMSSVIAHLPIRNIISVSGSET